MALKPEIKQLWLEALRSGEYQQGKKQLHKSTSEGDFFCCLGVLCDLASREGVVDPVIRDSKTVAYDCELDVLPASVMVWSGMESKDGYFTGYLPSLSVMNDEGITFTEIADEIERYL